MSEHNHDNHGRHGNCDNRDDHKHEYEYEQHAGNGTVNHGPLENPGPEESGVPGTAGASDVPDPQGAADFGPDGPGLGSDELALRRLLHQAVQEIEPVDGTLEHLRRAVPARRARKRQAVVGMAAAALFIGTAVPALVHVSNSSGSAVTVTISATPGTSTSLATADAPLPISATTTGSPSSWAAVISSSVIGRSSPLRCSATTSVLTTSAPRRSP